MPLIFCYFGVATFSQVNVDAVIGGTIVGVLVLIVLVIPLLGCLIYCKKKKTRELDTRYVVIQYASLKMMLII